MHPLYLYKLDACEATFTLIISPAAAQDDSVSALVNVGRWGFYRVRYDGEDWDAVVEAVKLSNVTVETIGASFGGDIAGLLDDAWAVSDAGEG